MTKLLQSRSEKKLSEISADEINLMKGEISAVIAEIKSLPFSDARKKLYDLRFGISKNTLMHLAAKFDHVQAVSEILTISHKDQMLVNAKNYHYLTPMHFVAIDGDVEVAKMLIDAGAEKSPQASEQKRGWMPIHYAVRHNNLKIIELLLSLGVDKESKTSFGLTPLIIAAEFGHLKILDFLLAKGANPNAQTHEDNDMMSVFHYAVVDGHFEVVDHLLKAGVARDKETASGLSALDFAARIDHIKITDLLMSWGVGDFDRAYDIAKKSRSGKVEKLIEKYIASRDKILSKKWLIQNEFNLVATINEYNESNLKEMKFIPDDLVSFNAYGILALKKEFGLFSKKVKTIRDVCRENEMVNLLNGLNRLFALIKASK